MIFEGKKLEQTMHNNENYEFVFEFDNDYDFSCKDFSIVLHFLYIINMIMI